MKMQLLWVWGGAAGRASSSLPLPGKGEGS